MAEVFVLLSKQDPILQVSSGTKYQGRMNLVTYAYANKKKMFQKVDDTT